MRVVQTSRSAIFVILLAVALLALGACSDDPEEEVAEDSAATATPEGPPVITPVATPAPVQGTLWRWGSITIIVPDRDDIFVHRGIAPPEEYPPDGGMAIWVTVGEAVALIDADTGIVGARKISESDEPLLASILDSVKVDESPAEDAMGWPYSAKQPVYSKNEYGNLRFWEPEPSAGIEASFGCGIGTDGEGCFVRVSNGRSHGAVDAATGEVLESWDVAAEDREVFERWVEAVEIVRP
jgi:hypothetical protein